MEEYCLKQSGEKDSPRLREAVKHLGTFPLFKDSKARLIDHAEYMQLVAEKKIAEPKSYWQIKEDKVGLICLSFYTTYTDTWEKITTAKGDFEDGWRACEAFNAKVKKQQ